MAYTFLRKNRMNRECARSILHIILYTTINIVQDNGQRLKAELAQVCESLGEEIVAVRKQLKEAEVSSLRFHCMLLL